MPQWDVLDSLPAVASTEKERPDTGSGKA